MCRNKISFIFPGQGSQFIGMGRAFFDNYEVARKIYEEASQVLGFDLASLCFNGALSELAKIENSFVAILTTSVAMYRVYMEEVGIEPQFCAGHSLGEYAALTCAGAISFCDAVRLVHKRAVLATRLMNSVPCGMTIIDSMNEEVVKEICNDISREERIVSISCFNSPDQVAVSGHNDALMELESRILEIGGKTTPLLSNAPFHSVLMKEAALEFKELLESCTFNNSKYPVIANVTARPTEDNRVLIDLLTKQLISPVRWQETIEYMKTQGTTMLVEFGAKNLLAGLAKEEQGGLCSFCYGIKKERENLYQYINSNKNLIQPRRLQV